MADSYEVEVLDVDLTRAMLEKLRGEQATGTSPAAAPPATARLEIRRYSRGDHDR